MTPSVDYERTRRWAMKSGPATLEDQLPGALRRGNMERVSIIQDALAHKAARRDRIAARKRPVPKERPTRLCAAWVPLAREVAAKHGVTTRDMLSGYRTARLASARWEFWSLLADRGVSLAEIGRRTGGYHHTTVMHGVAAWAARTEATCE